MALTATFDLDAYQLGAVNAFINSELDEIVYCEFPEGFERPQRCLLLQRALYGLRRSPLLWQKELSSTLLTLQLRQVPDEPCLFIGKGTIIFFYVDDIVLLCTPQART